MIYIINIKLWKMPAKTANFVYIKCNENFLTETLSTFEFSSNQVICYSTYENDGTVELTVTGKENILDLPQCTPVIKSHDSHDTCTLNSTTASK